MPAKGAPSKRIDLHSGLPVLVAFSIASAFWLRSTVAAGVDAACAAGLATSAALLVIATGLGVAMACSEVLLVTAAGAGLDATGEMEVISLRSSTPTETERPPVR